MHGIGRTAEPVNDRHVMRPRQLQTTAGNTGGILQLDSVSLRFMPLPVELEYGRHDLPTFRNDFFHSWALAVPAVESRTHWTVAHAGRQFVIPRSRPLRSSGGESERLVQVLKDPVRRQNLLVIRKADASDGPFGYFNAYSVFPSGEEELVGYSKLASHPRLASAHLVGVGVVGHAFRKPATLAAEVARLKLANDAAGLASLKKSVDPFEATPSKPSMSSKSYRGVGLGHLLIVLAEDVATRAGCRTLYTEAFKPTAGFVAKHGWRVLADKPSSIRCVKHMRPPHGIREHIDAWLGRWNNIE